MINTNFLPILHRFRDIAFDRSKIAFGYSPLVINSPGGGFFLGQYLRKIFCGCQWMAKVPNAVKILSKTSIAWVGCNARALQTDNRQTDGRAIAYSVVHVRYQKSNGFFQSYHHRWTATFFYESQRIRLVVTSLWTFCRVLRERLEIGSCISHRHVFDS